MPLCAPQAWLAPYIPIIEEWIPARNAFPDNLICASVQGAKVGHILPDAAAGERRASKGRSTAH